MKALQMSVTKIVRNATIQRFEFSFEAVWKLCQLYLREKEGIEVGSPKAAFRIVLKFSFWMKIKLMALRMADDRNLTVHTYNEPLAQQIFSHIPEYFKLMQYLLKEITDKKN